MPLAAGAAENLLLNSEFQFQAFELSRGKGAGNKSGSVPFWDQEAYGDAEVYRAPESPVATTVEPVDGVVVLKPGKSIRQFRLLSDLKLDVGDTFVLSVKGHQKEPAGLNVAVYQLLVDEEEGEWKPSDFGQENQKTFKRLARGEMIPIPMFSAASHETGNISLSKSMKLERMGNLPQPPSGKPNIIGLEVVFHNTSTSDVAVYAPRLYRAGEPRAVSTELPELYCHIPRTLSKLRRGEPLHLVVMGSSIDRGSANPPMYLYDETIGSPTFKQPISTPNRLFDGAAVGHPEWTPYFGWWQHYFCSTGWLRRALMRRYNYPVNKLLFNYMAADGSCVAESHSALAEWASLAYAPGPEANGHQRGKTWKELYPALFERPEGPRPDLVIFGSGANEKIDGPDEVAAFEGAIRWFQRHYPNVEFLFCMWNRTEQNASASMIKELTLRYGIPLVDIGRTLNLAQRTVHRDALFPKDGHPQAVAHNLWGRALETAFQPVDPIKAGIPQQHLPERLSPYTIGWEGEMVSFAADSPRIYKGKAFVLEDTVVNLWANSTKEKVPVFVDGVEWKNGSRLGPRKRDPRNSTFTTGKLSLGDRHIVEVGNEATIDAVDAKVVLNRVFIGVEDRRWNLSGNPVAFESQWGAPYGNHKAVLQPGQKATLQWVGTDCSVAWFSKEKGGRLIVRVDGEEKRSLPTHEPMTLASGEVVHMENRAGILGFPYGLHTLEVEAVDGSVDLLGMFQYDTRPNLGNQRVVHGVVSPGATVPFGQPFRATPVVFGGNGVRIEKATTTGVTFHRDSAPGIFQATGE